MNRPRKLEDMRVVKDGLRMENKGNEKKKKHEGGSDVVRERKMGGRLSKKPTQSDKEYKIRR